MIIHRNMDLGQLHQLMGDVATREEAAALRDILVDTGIANTDDIAEADWLELLELAVWDVVADGIDAEADRSRA